MPSSSTPHSILLEKLQSRQACIGVIGLGYVGLPLVRVLIDAGFHVLGLDTDPSKIATLEAGESYIKNFEAAWVQAMLKTGRLTVSTQPETLPRADAILICVPTPLTKNREPDMHYVVQTAETIATQLRPGQLIILESTTYPGTSTELIQPILEKTGLKVGQEFFLAYSPEREDPGNIQYTTTRIPKVVGADDPYSRELASCLYESAIQQVVTVRSSATAEAVKLTENIFRSVNIALVNELKIVFTKMGIDIWEVIDAAKTKPFGFMPFYPGPGLGGHCIPIDPFYLTWKAREYGIATHFVELAGQINTAMPHYILERLREALDQHFKKGLRDARILLCGMAYKKNVDDMRESPSLVIFESLLKYQAQVDYYDPFIPVLPATRQHPALANQASIPWDLEAIAQYDAVIICTDHDGVDYAALATHARLIIDTRNAISSTTPLDHVIKA